MTILIVYVVVIFLLLQLSGIFHFIRDSRAYHFYRGYSFYRFIARQASWVVKWYIGGNKFYNPSFGGDLIHWCDSAIRIVLVMAALVTAAFSFLATDISWYWYWGAVGLLIPFYYFGEWTFTLLYHTWDTPIGEDDYVPLGRNLLNLITPWRNFHA